MMQVADTPRRIPPRAKSGRLAPANPGAAMLKSAASGQVQTFEHGAFGRDALY